VRPHHEITDIRELQPGQPLRGAGRGATVFYGVRGGWSGIATGYLLVVIDQANLIKQQTGSIQKDKAVRACYVFAMCTPHPTILCMLLSGLTFPKLVSYVVLVCVIVGSHIRAI
jgi:hypothetical protein